MGEGAMGTAAELETGWLPTTPIEDTYLRRFLFTWASAASALALLHGGAVQAREAFLFADSGRAGGFLNCATLTQPLSAQTASETLADIARLFAFDRPERIGDALLVSAWPTGDLRFAGWNLMGHPPVHLLPAGHTPRPAPPELTIAAVTDPDALRAWERVVIAGYPLEAIGDAPPGTLMPVDILREPRSRMWLGSVNGRPVCASWAWSEHGTNSVVMVATIADARRRGYGEAVTWRAALADPSLPAMLLSTDEGRPVYERMGFLPLWRFTLWYRNRPE
jgi:hypothetical protein